MAISKAQKRKLRAEVFTADQWTCQDCGKVIRPATPDEEAGAAAPMHADGDWLELEHIVPLAHGGTWDRSNLRAACTTCNRIKRASLSHSGWEKRITVAIAILTTRPACRDTAERAIRVLSEVAD